MIYIVASMWRGEMLLSSWIGDAKTVWVKAHEDNIEIGPFDGEWTLENPHSLEWVECLAIT